MHGHAACSNYRNVHVKPNSHLKMAKFGYIFYIAALPIVLGVAYFDRDILLTPNRTLQQPGKAAYFRPATARQQRSNAAATGAGAKDAATAVTAATPSPAMPSKATVPWEEPLKHAIYLVLNHKVDDGGANGDDDGTRQPTTPDAYNQEAIYRAAYHRSANHANRARFGDIIPLARGRLEAAAGQYSLIEMDLQQCDKISCAANEPIAANVSAVWTVEMVRHRSPNHGHANELKLTVYPVVKQKVGDEKRRAGKITSRTFVVRDRDYPRYFDDAELPLSGSLLQASAPQVQRRTFDMLTGLASHTRFDEYRLPLQFSYGLGNGAQHAHEELNIGEYYAGGGGTGLGDIGATAPSFYPSTVKYASPTAFAPTPYHQHLSTEHLLQAGGGSHVRFPTAGGITGPADTEFLDRISTTPLTATHLHHHYYLNPGGIRGDAVEKENLYDKTPAYHHQQAVNLQSLQESHLGDEHGTHQPHPTVSPNVGPSAIVDYDGHDAHAHHQSLTEHPHFGFQTHRPHSPYTNLAVNQHEQTTAAILAAQAHHHQQQQNSAVTYGPGIGQQFGDHHHPLQIASPPQQHLPYYNQNEIPPGYQKYAPNHAFPVLANIVHPRFNQPGTISPAFRPNFQLLNDQFSEPDPLYHQQQLGVLQQHLNAHLLLHQYPEQHQYAQHGQTHNTQHATPQPHLHPHTLDVVPLNANGVPLGGTGQAAVLTTGKGAYEIPPVKLQLDPAGNNASSYGPSAGSTSGPSGPDVGPSGGAATGPSGTTGSDNAVTSTKRTETVRERGRNVYPDSINAQLPPPSRDDDVTVPYVDSTRHVEQASNEVRDTAKPSRKNSDRLSVVRLKPRKKEPTTTTPAAATTTSTSTESEEGATTTAPTTQPPSPTLPADKVKRGRIRMGQFQQKTTTEKPILKWMPKRTRARVPNEFTSPASSLPVATTSSTSTTTSGSNVLSATTTDVSETIPPILVTPTPEAVDEDEARTSISTSISVKVGNDQPVSDEVAREIYKGFLPTRLPGGAQVQLTRGNLTAIATNSSAVSLFRATGDGAEAEGGDDEDQIARSILRHAQSV